MMDCRALISAGEAAFGSVDSASSRVTAPKLLRNFFSSYPAHEGCRNGEQKYYQSSNDAPGSDVFENITDM